MTFVIYKFTIHLKLTRKVTHRKNKTNILSRVFIPRALICNENRYVLCWV